MPRAVISSSTRCHSSAYRSSCSRRMIRSKQHPGILASYLRCASLLCAATPSRSSPAASSCTFVRITSWVQPFVSSIQRTASSDRRVHRGGAPDGMRRGRTQNSIESSRRLAGLRRERHATTFLSRRFLDLARSSRIKQGLPCTASARQVPSDLFSWGRLLTSGICQKMVPVPAGLEVTLSM